MVSGLLDLTQCSIGKALNYSCHEVKFTKIKKTKGFEELTKKDQELVHLRSKVNHIQTICNHHVKVYLDRFETLYDGSFCCDPFNKHKVKLKNNGFFNGLSLCYHIESIRVISLDVAKEFDLIPGHKLCTECRKMLYLRNNKEDYGSNSCQHKDNDFNEINILKENFDSSINRLGCLP
ncbi:ARL14 effector protein-like [Hydra vulgaris]|uniref:ARL14 effector protein-like n=1 Tax=Hydra vulgaris TaxID=6087 RepID=A0ABM4BMF9_HYDVU